MGILPPDIIAQILPLHSQDTLPDQSLQAYARLTVTSIGFTWFILELHTDGDLFSAYLIDKNVEQFGYFSFAYLEEHLQRFAKRLTSGQNLGTAVLCILSQVKTSANRCRLARRCCKSFHSKEPRVIDSSFITLSSLYRLYGCTDLSSFSVRKPVICFDKLLAFV